MVPIACEVFPRADAAPEELQQLGRALVLAIAARDNVAASLDIQALRSLLAGEQPGSRRALPEEVLASLGAAERKRIELLLGPESRRASVYITAWGEDGRRAVEGLREMLPAEAVEDIRVYGLG
jgi:hypothetical protein